MDGVALLEHARLLQRVGAEALDELVAQLVRMDHGLHGKGVGGGLEDVDVLGVLLALLRDERGALRLRQGLDVVEVDADRALIDRGDELIFGINDDQLNAGLANLMVEVVPMSLLDDDLGLRQ